MQAINILSGGIRVAASAGFSAAVTAALFLLMYSLIATDIPEIKDKVIRLAGVVMADREPIETRPDLIKPRPQDPEPQPPMPRIEESFKLEEGTVVALAPVIGPTQVVIGEGVSSGTAMAIFKVAPQYPRRAVARGIEGYVDLMFDITAAGKTENIRVVYAEPQGIFESASIKTLAKWKYKPAMEDGVPRPQKNQTTRISYELEQ